MCEAHETHFAQQEVYSERLIEDRKVEGKQRQREYLQKKRTGRW